MLNQIKKIAGSLMEKRFTLQYPVEREKLPDGYRGKLRLDMKTCISCSACAIICPNKTIDMVEVTTDKGVKKMPQVNHERCLFCGLCEEVCPPKCLTLTKNYDHEKYDRREFLIWYSATFDGIIPVLPILNIPFSFASISPCLTIPTPKVCALLSIPITVMQESPL